MRASGPTARPAHASPHLIDADLDAALPGGFLLGRSDPTDPLVSRQRGDIGPKARGSGVKLDGFSEICWQLMDRAVREFLTGHTSKRVCSAQRERDKPRQGVGGKHAEFTPQWGRWLHRLVRSLARERRDKCESSLRLGLRLFLVFLPFFIRQPLTFDDLALPTLVEFESKQKRSFEKPPVRIILNSFDI